MGYGIAVLGYTAAAVGSVLMLPQAVRTWRTRQADELSLGTLGLYVLNCGLWLGYGELVRSGPVLVANAVGLAIGGIELGLKLRLTPR